jgi:SAM-dependent methyltransferase
MKLIVNRQNLFDLERLRNTLAIHGDFTRFKETYLLKANNIKNRNTGLFWNKKIIEEKESLQKSPIYNHKINTIVDLLSVYKGKVLDIGFGYGDVEKKLKFSKERVLYGVDISSVAIENLKKVINGHFRKGNIFALPYKKSFFDVVLVLDVLEHIPPKNIFRSLKEIKRVTKKNGVVIISIPLNENLEEMLVKDQNPNSHQRVYTPNIIKTELNLFGFKVVDESYFFAFNNLYFLKTLLMKLIPFKIRRPNLMILKAIKK